MPSSAGIKGWLLFLFVLGMGALLFTGLLTMLVPATIQLTAGLVCPAGTRLEHRFVGRAGQRTGTYMEAACVDREGVAGADDVYPRSFAILWAGCVLGVLALVGGRAARRYRARRTD